MQDITAKMCRVYQSSKSLHTSQKWNITVSKKYW